MDQEWLGLPQKANYTFQPPKARSSYQCPLLGHKAEISHENASSASSNKLENKYDNSKSKKGRASSMSKQKDSDLSSGSTSSKGSSLDSKKSNPDLSSKPTKDGKLSPQERQHHLNKTCASSADSCGPKDPSGWVPRCVLEHICHPQCMGP